MDLDLIRPVEKRVLSNECIQTEVLEDWEGDLEVQRLGELDAFYVDDVLSECECETLIEVTEGMGYSFWHEDENKKAFRNAETVEVNHPEIAGVLWRRLKQCMNKFRGLGLSITEEETPERYQCDLKGDWSAINTNEHLLFAKYNEGGHFSPHTDGYDIKSFDVRSMYSIVLFLNTTEKGGGTRFYKEEQKQNLVQDSLGRFCGQDKYVEATVDSKRGRCVVFFHNIMHEGMEIEAGTKYIIRSDVIYSRDIPILTQTKDISAYELYKQALNLAEDSAKLEEATTLFRTAFKRSPLLAEIFGM